MFNKVCLTKRLYKIKEQVQFLLENYNIRATFKYLVTQTSGIYLQFIYTDLQFGCVIIYSNASLLTQDITLQNTMVQFSSVQRVLLTYTTLLTAKTGSIRLTSIKRNRNYHKSHLV